MQYSIGSISKQFTAAAILLLTEEGKLSLDDSVAKYLPGLTRANEVTLRMLLSHTSGYQDFWPEDYVMTSMMVPTTAQHILDVWGRKPVQDEVEGTTFKHRIAEAHATSMKRLSKIETADDPSDGAGDE